jgi:D-alanyl-D-alanine carboxypeptidase/D-alanyl-D-alanine-endopeptidase (penicillin-binding protein 4)
MLGLPAVFLAAGFLAGTTGGSAGPPATRVAASPLGALATPILSVRRDPGWIEDTIVHQRLGATLSRLTSGHFGGAREPAGCVVASQGGAALYQLNPAQELLPASNLKVVTATAVLDTLGAGDRFTTAVSTTRRPARGVLDGNLYLVGGGDPYLLTDAYDRGLHYPEPSYTSLDRLAAAVRAAGITRVTGSVVGDGSRYDSLVGVPTWSPEYLAEGDVGPLSALEVDDGSIPPTPAHPSTGTSPVHPASPAPALYAAQIFQASLEAHGVNVSGPAATGRSPAGAVRITQAESAPLGDYVEQMLRVSDDTAAELLTKELGYRTAGQGTTRAGTGVIRHDLATDGLPAGPLVAADGSGLDRGDRVTCSLVAGTLSRAGTTGVIAAGLPVAARTGTLTDRMKNTVAAGRLRAKTGTLKDVAALSGFVQPVAGQPTEELSRPLYFSVIINGMDSDQAAPLADQIGVALAAYPQTVPLKLLGPRS